MNDRKTAKYLQAAFLELQNHTPNIVGIPWKSIYSSSAANTPTEFKELKNLDAKERLAFVNAKLENAQRKFAKMKALEGNHDASTLVMGSKTSVIEGQDTGDANV